MDKPKEGGTVAHDVTSEGKKESKQRSQARNEGGGRGHHGQGDQRQSRNWKGGNNWHRRGSQRPPKKHVSAEALSLESILAREDKPIVFDLTRDKLELNEWFKSYAPSKIRRSDGIGWIMVIFIINIILKIALLFVLISSGPFRTHQPRRKEVFVREGEKSYGIERGVA